MSDVTDLSPWHALGTLVSQVAGEHAAVFHRGHADDLLDATLEVMMDLLGAFILGSAIPVYRVWRSNQLELMLANGKAEMILAPICGIQENDDSRTVCLQYELDGEIRKVSILEGISPDVVGCRIPVYRYLDGSGTVKADPNQIDWSRVSGEGSLED